MVVKPGSFFTMPKQLPRRKYLEFIVQKCMEEKTDECVLWPYAKTKDGYGMVSINKKTRSAHGYAYEFAFGIPIKRDAAHLCHPYRNCINPLHIKECSRKENINDKLKTKTSARHIFAKSRNTSGYKGVSYNYNKWTAKIALADGTQLNLGSYESVIEAARAYDAGVIKYWTDTPDAYLNFPEPKRRV
jgi:hypothetical protein